jgi:hypothetical protein
MLQISPSVWLGSDGWVVGYRFGYRRSGSQEVRRQEVRRSGSRRSGGQEARR